VQANELIGIFTGLSAVILIGAITIWASVANAGRPISAVVKLFALAGFLGVLLFGLGLIPPIPADGRPSDALPPTPPVGNTPNSVLSSSPLDSDVLVYSWDFTADDSRWRAQSCDKFGATQEARVESGRMIVAVRSGAGQCATRFILDAPPELADVDVESTLQRVDGPATMTYGLVIRKNDNIGDIYFLFGPNQQFGVFARNRGENDGMLPLLPWSRTESIAVEGPNRLRVVAKGKNVSVYINGQALSTFRYEDVIAGSTGVVTTIYEPNLSGSVSIDDFRVSRVR
jgi:hypothetical protein